MRNLIIGLDLRSQNDVLFLSRYLVAHAAGIAMATTNPKLLTYEAFKISSHGGVEHTIALKEDAFCSHILKMACFSLTKKISASTISRTSEEKMLKLHRFNIYNILRIIAKFCNV